MADLIKALEDQLRTPSTVINVRSKKRILPSQPTNTPSSKVYVGSDLGFLQWTGQKPRAGDMVVITGQGADLMVTTGQSGSPQRNPTFSGVPCVCKCPRPAGTVAILTRASSVNQCLIIDGSTSLLLQIVGQDDLGYSDINAQSEGPSVAYDDEEPFDLYILDDLRLYKPWTNDQNPQSLLTGRRYLRLNHYTIVGAQYEILSRFDITDPYTPTLAEPVAPLSEPDLPCIGVGGNCLSVLAGIPHITMFNPPARYIQINGALQTILTLTRNGDPYDFRLASNIIRVTQSPGKESERYVLSTDITGITWNLLKFNSNNEIKGIVPLGDFPLIATVKEYPVQLIVSCNQIFAIVGRPPQGGIVAG